MRDFPKDIFFQLLHLGLWGEGKLSSARLLDEDEWTMIYRFAKEQTVEGILFDGFALLTEEQLPPRLLRLQWAARVDQIERHNQQMNEVIAAQSSGFSRLGVKAVLLKGQGVADRYRFPLHRVSGDIDWWFEGNGYDKVWENLRKKKLSVRTAVDFSLEYQWRGVSVEHHRRLFDSENPFKRSYLKKLEKRYRPQQQKLLIGEQQVTLLAPELQLFQVNLHIFKHLIGFGVGLRQLCDSARLYRAYHDRIEAGQLHRMYRKLGLLKWINLLHHILVKNLGLPQRYLPFPVPKGLNTDWMMEEIWASGNFGFYDDRFAKGKVTFASARPDSTRRLSRNLRLYFKYAPQEVLFFLVRRTAAKLITMLRK